MNWDLASLPRGRGRVHLDIAEGLATLTLDNPAARNAMSVGMMLDLVEAVDRLTEASVVAILVHGAGDAAFCAGGDLADVRAHLLDPAAAEGMPRVVGDALDKMSSLPAVVVAAVEGAALGGGAELLTACDWVVASSSARIGFVHASLGVAPGWGGGARLVRRVGARRALPLLARAERLSAASALEVGLVDEVVDAGSALVAAQAWIERLCSLPPEAVRGVVSVVRAARDDPDRAVALERRVFGELWGGDAHRAALAMVMAGE